MILRCLLIVFLVYGLAAQSPPPPVLSDAQIDSQLRERLGKSVIGKDGFNARVKGGIVYWEGTTAVAQHKGAATRMAKSAGARRVVNNIRVTGTGKSGARSAEVSKEAAGVPVGQTSTRSAASKAEPAKVGQADPITKQAPVRWVPLRH